MKSKVSNKFGNQNLICGVEATLNVIGKKWTVLIVRDLLDGKRRFSELQRSLVGISPRTLAERLTELEGDQIITKKIFAEVPPHTEYALTPAGKQLAGILDQMRVWHAQRIN